MDAAEKTGSVPEALARDVAGMMAWWRDAGVDLCFDDEPAQWISPAQPTALSAERLRTELREAVPVLFPARSDGIGKIPPARADAIDRATMPDELAQFTQWWLAEPSLDGGRSGGRVPPRGPAGAALMVLVPEPEADDSVQLLSGRQGRLLAAILFALGLGEDAVYVASALPRHMPMPDWADIATLGFGDVLTRHVALVAPRRLVAFGDSVLSLLGNNPPHTAAVGSVLAHGGKQVPLFAARSLDALLARPAWKAELWNGLLGWMPPDADRPTMG